MQQKWDKKLPNKKRVKRQKWEFWEEMYEKLGGREYAIRTLCDVTNITEWFGINTHIEDGTQQIGTGCERQQPNRGVGRPHESL